MLTHIIQQSPKSVIFFDRLGLPLTAPQKRLQGRPAALAIRSLRTLLRPGLYGMTRATTAKGLAPTVRCALAQKRQK
jgi:hypothetical protein